MAVRLGPFDVGAQLATGGMGEVRSATHRPSGLPVAIKLIRRDRLDASSIGEFESEIRAQARIDHPGVVYLFDHGRLDSPTAQALDLQSGMPWLAMEYCSSSLFEVAGGLSWKGVRQVVLQLLDALSHAHAVGVLHRDIKLGNVLVSTAADLRPGVKLADFGIAHALGDDDEETRSIGTPRYMAPEQVRGEWEFHGPWTDLYALGVLAWRLITGRRPWPKLQGVFLARAMCSQPIGWPGSRFPVPPGTREWVERLTAKNPWDRYQLAADASAALRQLPAEVDGEIWHPAGRSLFIEHKALTLVPDEAADDVPRPRAPVVNPQDDPPAESEASIRLHMAGIGLLPLRRPAFIGRRHERRVAWESLRRVAQRGRPMALCVLGPPRIGRTRFLQWLGEAAERVGQAVCVPIVCKPDRPLSTSVLRSLRKWFRVGSLNAVSARVHLESWLGDGPWLTDFAALLVRGEASDESWMHTVASGLAALGRLRPAIVRIEGGRWVPESAVFVRALLAENHAPLMVVVDTELPGLPALTLGPLADASMHRLANAFVALDPDVRSRLVGRAEGSPGFLVMTLVHWGSMGLLREGRRGFVVTAENALPPTFAVVAAARLHAVMASLPEGGIESLERAMLLDDPFSLDDWAGIDGGEAREHVRSEVVRVLADRGLLVGPSNAYTLPSVPFREAVLDAAESRLPDHHARCAAYLEQRRPVDSLALGRHRLAAGEVEAALEPLRQGLVQLTSTRGAAAGLPVAGPLEEAVVRLSGPLRIRWTAILDELRSGMLIDVGQLEPAEENARSALRTGEVLGDPDLVGRCWARLGAVAARRGADNERVACFQKALDLQENVEVPVVASWWMELAKAHLALGDRRRWGTCMAAAASTSLGQGGPRFVRGLGEAAQHQLEGQLAGALACLDEAYAAASEEGSAMARLSVLRARGHTLLEAGESIEARRVFEEALELALTLRASRVPAILANVVALDFALKEPRVAMDRYTRHRFVLPAGNDGEDALVPAHCAALAVASMAQEWRKVTYHFERIRRHGRWSWAALNCNAALVATAAERVKAKGRTRLAGELVRYGLQRAGPLGDHVAHRRLQALADEGAG